MYIVTSPVDELIDASGIERRDSDFKWTGDGEMLSFNVAICDSWRHNGGCGCERAFVGLDSLKASTLAIVGEMNEAKVQAKVLLSGYASAWSDVLSGDDFWEMARELHAEIEKQDIHAGDFVRIIFDTSLQIQTIIKAY